MKAWLKGGLVGVGFLIAFVVIFMLEWYSSPGDYKSSTLSGPMLQMIFYISYPIYYLIPDNWVAANFLVVIILAFIYFFLLGSLIGWIISFVIGKIKLKKKAKKK